MVSRSTGPGSGNRISRMAERWFWKWEINPISSGAAHPKTRRRPCRRPFRPRRTRADWICERRSIELPEMSLKDVFAKSAFAALFCSALFATSAAQTALPNATTAWKDGHFHVDVAGVISRSDIVLARPNEEAGQAMSLGNGRLGVAVWSEDGLTAQ